MCILCVYVYMCGGSAGVCVCGQTWRPQEGTRFPPLSLSAYPFEAEYSTDVWVSQNITKSHVITKFFKTSIIWFYVTTLGNLVFGFRSAKQCRVWVPNHWVVLRIVSSLLMTPSCFVPPLFSQILQALHHCKSNSLRLAWSLHFSSVVYRVPLSVLKTPEHKGKDFMQAPAWLLHLQRVV